MGLPVPLPPLSLLTEHPLTCAVPTCRLLGQHHQHCTDRDVCRGCLPQRAVPGEALCEHHAAQLTSWLVEIPTLYVEVVNPTGAEHRPKDPVTRRLPAGPVPGASHQDRVSGSATGDVPARFNEAAGGTCHPTSPLYQVGDPPAAVQLDSWARDWQTYTGALLPPPTVGALCRWLRTWLPHMLRHHPAMADFHTEIGDIHHRLRVEAGATDPKPEHCYGVPCRRCDRLNLYRTADGTGDVECHTPDCRLVYRRHDYDRWVGMLAAAVKVS